MALPSPSARDPSRTIAILFGASRWEKYEGLDSVEYAAAYEVAAQRIRTYFTSRDGLALPEGNLLDLFDSKSSAIDLDGSIRTFLRKHVAGEVAMCADVIVYFIGHGTLNVDGRFVFVIGSTERERVNETSYTSRSLAGALKVEAPRQRRWIFLDCCASASSLPDFQPGKSIFDGLKSDTNEFLPPSGSALFCACAPDGISRADKKYGCTVFTGALVEVLKRGDESLAEELTLYEIAALTQANINERLGPDGVRPDLSDPDQRKGMLSTHPFFPNPARKAQSLESLISQLSLDMQRVLRRIDTLEGRQEAYDQGKSERSAGSGDLSDKRVGRSANSPQPDRDHRNITDLSFKEVLFLDSAKADRRRGIISLFVATVCLLLTTFLVAAMLIDFSNGFGPRFAFAIITTGISLLSLIGLGTIIISRKEDKGFSFDSKLAMLARNSRYYSGLLTTPVKRTVIGRVEAPLLIGVACFFFLSLVIGIGSLLIVDPSPGVKSIPAQQAK
jgi:hypothetical protein